MLQFLCALLTIWCSTPSPEVTTTQRLSEPSAVHSIVKSQHKYTKHFHKKKQTTVKRLPRSHPVFQAREKVQDELFPEVARRVQAIRKKPTSELPTAVTGHCKMDKCRDCKHTEKSGIQRCKPTLCTHKNCPFTERNEVSHENIRRY